MNIDRRQLALPALAIGLLGVIPGAMPAFAGADEDALAKNLEAFRTAQAASNAEGLASLCAAQQGANIFDTHCSGCHSVNSQVHAPRRDDLAQMRWQDILKALETGAMRAQGSSLTPAERSTDVAQVMIGDGVPDRAERHRAECPHCQWVTDNHTDKSTLYTGAGATIPLVVDVPGGPTGTVFNPSTTDFVITGGGTSGVARLFIIQRS